MELILEFKRQASKVIGFKKNWEQLLKKKGLSYKGHKLIKKKVDK